MEGKETFILYKKYLKPIEKLSMEERGELFTLILEYVNDLDPKESDNPLVAVMFSMIQTDLKSDLVKWKNTVEERRKAGKKGGLKSAENRSQVKQNQANQANATNSKQTQANQAKPSKMKQNQANQAVYDNEYEYDYDNDRYKDKKDINGLAVNNLVDLLIKKDFISSTDTNIPEYAELFQTLIQIYRAKNVGIATKYIIANTNSKKLKNPFEYFKKAMFNNLDKNYDKKYDSKDPMPKVTQEDVDELLAEIGDE